MLGTPQKIAGPFEEPPVEGTKLTWLVLLTMKDEWWVCNQLWVTARIWTRLSSQTQFSPGGVTAASKMFTLSGSARSVNMYFFSKQTILHMDRLMTYWLCGLASFQKKVPSSSAWTQCPHCSPPSPPSCLFQPSPHCCLCQVGPFQRSICSSIL